LEVPFCWGSLLFRQQQFSLLGGLFRAYALVSSNGGVKNWG